MPEPRPGNVPTSGDSEDHDRLLDRFETAWQSGTPPVLEEFLPAGRPGRRKVLHELIKIDLEYRWRRPPARQGDKEKRRQGDQKLSCTATPCRDSWPARPRLEDYAKRFPRLGPPQRLPVDLIGEEYRVRQCWGDRPGHAEYAGRFPRHGAALRAELARIDGDLHTEMATERLRPRSSPDRSPEGPAPPESVPLRCPHCRCAVEIVADLTPSDLACPACGGVFSVESHAPGGAAPPPPKSLGRYELGGLLGTGAFGSVWQGRDTELARDVAVKLPRSGRFSSPEEEERFLREARSAAQLHHPGIVAVYDVGRARETLYIISELVRGVSLAERLRGGRLSFGEAAELTARAADALDYAHRQGVVHRDVKPSNILLGREDASPAEGSLRPLLTDFGLALRDAGEVTMTLDGQVLGTPAYMSPEQVRNPHAVDGRSDLYSLGVILYELLTGELPFRGMTRMLLVQVLSDEPRPPRRLNDRIPRDLETICLKCLAKEPGRRYQTTGALAADLRRWLAREPIRARPAGWAARLWLWVKRHPALALTGALGTAALAAVTGAPLAAALVAVAAAALLFALHQAKTAAELAQAVAEAKRTQRKTAAALQFAFKNYALAREEKERAVAAEAKAQRRLAPARELVRAVLFDLPDKIEDASPPAAARALLVRTALTYLDGLAKEVGDDALLLRELAVAYARMGDVQGSPNYGDAAGALASYRQSLGIFESLAGAYPDNAQAQRDLTLSREKAEERRQAVGKVRPGGPRSDAAPTKTRRA